MTGPNDVLDALIRSERQSPPVAPPDASARGWTRLRRELGAVVVLPQIDVPPGLVESAAVGKSVASSVVGWGWVGKAIASAVVTVGVGGVGIAASGIRRPVAPQQHTGAVAAATAPEVASTTAAEPTARPPRELPGVANPAVEISTPLPSPAMPSVQVPVAEASRAVERRTSTPRAAEPAGIDVEAPIIAAALRALKADDPARALALLDGHRKRYPSGVMTEDREALRISALCRTDRAAEAVRLRTTFFQRWPDSTHAARVRAECSVAAQPASKTPG